MKGPKDAVSGALFACCKQGRPSERGAPAWRQTARECAVSLLKNPKTVT
ncbi:MAG: hypothetical protein JRK26_27220 [Deltaproteobacteria bacterium]|nr:hypothetical protein [Deltaproteobacteria bacterium]